MFGKQRQFGKPASWLAILSVAAVVTFPILARISHKQPAAMPNLPVSTALRSIGILDVLESETRTGRTTPGGVPDDVETALRFDGIYQAESSGKYWYYLRFYEDGMVLSVSSSGKPGKVFQWLNKTYPRGSKGQYKRSGSHIQFSTRSPAGVVDYEGEIRGDSLALKSYSHINKMRFSRVYRFVDPALLPQDRSRGTQTTPTYKTRIRPKPKRVEKEQAANTLKETTTPGKKSVTEPAREHLEVLRSAKTIRVVVRQSYGKAAGVSLPFEDLAKRLAGYAGLKVAAPDDVACDLRLVINAKGIALRRTYGKTTLYSGASLSGSAAFEHPGVPIYEREFKGKAAAPFMLVGTTKSSVERIMKYKTPSGAPFDKPFRKPGSFIPVIVEMMGGVYGTDLLMQAIKEKDSSVRAAARDALIKFKEPDAVEPLLALLKAPGYNFRTDVVMVLGHLNDSRAVGPLIGKLKDRFSKTRSAAATALGQIRDPRAVQPLVTALRDGSSSVRLSAAGALWNFEDTRAVQPLIALLGDREKTIREQAVTVLEKCGSSAVESLIAALNHKDIKVRRAASKLLGKIKDPRAVEPLLTAMRPGRGTGFAKGALLKMGWLAVEPLVKLTGSSHADDRNNAADVLKKIFDSIIKRMDNYRTRAAARQEMVKIGTPAIRPLIEALSHRNHQVRSGAAGVLREIGAPAVEPLIAVLRDKNSPHRSRAVVVLGSIRDPRAVEPLIHALKEPDFPGRGAVVEALGKFNDPRAVEPLLAVLKDKNSPSRGKAGLILGKIGDPRALEPLVEALKDRDFQVRTSIGNALGEMKDPRVVAPLIEMLDDPHVYPVVCNILEKITGFDFGQSPEKWRKWWEKNKKKYLKLNEAGEAGLSPKSHSEQKGHGMESPYQETM